VTAPLTLGGDHTRAGYAVAKRALDLVLVLGTLPLWLPVCMTLALLVAVSSRGPVLYRGVRTGRGGVPFRMWKFRTMVVGAERAGTTTRQDDARITRVGHWLRRSKLDELPQLVHVLTGTMSLVGPRPEVAEHADAYSAEERRILSVRPGITDYASLRFADLARELGTDDPHGEYVRRVRAEKNRLRLQYVHERSLAVDVAILARTAWLVVRRVLGVAGAGAGA